MWSLTRAKLNPKFQYFSELGKRLKYSLRPKHKNPNFESKDELKNYVRIWVSLLKIKGIYIKYDMHTTEYLAFGKDLLARLYLTVKVYINKLLDVYIIYNKSHALNE